MAEFLRRTKTVHEVSGSFTFAIDETKFTSLVVIVRWNSPGRREWQRDIARLNALGGLIEADEYDEIGDFDNKRKTETSVADTKKRVRKEPGYSYAMSFKVSGIDGAIDALLTCACVMETKW